LNIQKYWIVPQAFGTAVYMGISDAIVINIGHGTTEYQVVENNIPSVGYSDSMAASILINDRTNAEYTDKNNFDTPEVKRELVRLVAYIKNQYEKLRAKSPKKYPLVIAGGGILIPGMKEEITKQFKKEFQVPDNPVFSNAIGMHRHAQKKSKVKPKEPAPSTENTVEPTTDGTPSP